MPPEAPRNKYWVYVNNASKGNYRKETEAIRAAEKLVRPNNEVVIIELRYKQDYRLHVWINGVQTVKSGKLVK